MPPLRPHKRWAQPISLDIAANTQGNRGHVGFFPDIPLFMAGLPDGLPAACGDSDRSRKARRRVGDAPSTT
jgi:hypothetical protein